MESESSFNKADFVAYTDHVAELDSEDLVEAVKARILSLRDIRSDITIAEVDELLEGVNRLFSNTGEHNP